MSTVIEVQVLNGPHDNGKGAEVRVLECSGDNSKKKQKAAKQSSISPEEIAQRKAAARGKVLANTLKSKLITKLSAEERDALKKQEEAKKLAAYQDRWEASHKDRMHFCRYASLACLVATPQRLDPIIGTAACQQYAILAVLLHNLLRRHCSGTEWFMIEKTCRKFVGAAAVSDYRANLIPVTNYKLPAIPQDVDSFFKKCGTIFSVAQLRYLQLALLLWENTVLSYDEFGQVCRSRGNASLGRYESEIRSEFSCLADKLYTEETSLLGSDKLSEVYRKTTSEYYMDKERAYPIKCPSVFTTFDINNHLAWNSDLIIALGVTRVGISPDQSSSSDYCYRLGFCDIYYYKKGISTFELIEEPSVDDRYQACVFFDCVGTSFAYEHNRTGMYSLDKAEFSQTFKTIDPVWLLMSWAAGHPDRAGRAEQSMSLRDVHNEVFGRNHTRELSHNQRTLEKLDFSLAREDQATAAEILKYGLAQAITNNQIGDCYFNDITVEKTDAVPRTTTELYLHIVHVYASIGKAEEQRLCSIRERHAATGPSPGLTPPSIGRYVFTNSKSGLSCVSRNQATTLQASNKRLQDYLAYYPAQEVFTAPANMVTSETKKQAMRRVALRALSAVIGLNSRFKSKRTSAD